ncbi:hypothetical protein [Cryptosporangium phraense]|uniref:Uncharacterized protein n=1 Tax=Cryptosporangium phraense TaxID=2593070 RepID=A0A545ALT1_9ACTN|nr:hypothetical protein [Cryptosporangium phraense]TQS42277.1 hypothetical protein FL583_25435 [Cryptosporangium phraense]
MDAEAWIGLLTVVIALFTIAVMYQLARRERDEPTFTVLRMPTATGWVLTAHNVGRSEALLAWFELVPDVYGRATEVRPGTATRVPAGGHIRTEVVRAGRTPGMGIDLCWVDRSRGEHRLPIPLPERVTIEPAPPSGPPRRKRRRRPS